MGIEERRHREKEQRRSNILDAAERVFFAKGIDVATMDEVAESAELSKGTLYLYFKSKEDLYLGVNVRALEKLYEILTAAENQNVSGMEQLITYGEAYFKFAEDYPNYFETLLYFEAETFDLNNPTVCVKEYSELRQKIALQVKARITKGIADGSLRSDINPPLIQLYLWAASSGLIQVMSKKADMIQAIHGIDAKLLKDVYFHVVRHSFGTGK